MILGVPTSTANTAIFLELNLSLITTLVQIKILKFLVRLKDDEINKEVYLKNYCRLIVLGLDFATVYSENVIYLLLP